MIDVSAYKFEMVERQLRNGVGPNIGFIYLVIDGGNPIIWNYSTDLILIERKYNEIHEKMKIIGELDERIVELSGEVDGHIERRRVLMTQFLYNEEGTSSEDIDFCENYLFERLKEINKLSNRKMNIFIELINEGGLTLEKISSNYYNFVDIVNGLKE